jgi:hypothetical protein
MQMRKNLITAGFLFLLLLLPAANSAQQTAGGKPTRVPVTVALVDDLTPSGVPFVIQRRPDLAPHDVILLRADATADQLSDAVRSLLVVRQAGGDTALSPATRRMRPRGPQPRGERRALPWVPRVFADGVDVPPASADHRRVAAKRPMARTVVVTPARSSPRLMTS